MIRNYTKITFRNLRRNKVFSFINIFGLAVGIAASLFILHYVRFEKSYEDYNAYASNMYRITLDLYKGSEYIMTDCETHAGIGQMVKDKMPEVAEFVRMFHNDGLQEVEVGGRKFLEEGIYFADSNAVRLFSVNVVAGNRRTALVEPYQAILSTSTAVKLFGTTDVVGKSVNIDRIMYNVAAVMDDLHPNTHLKFKILLSHTTIAKVWDWYGDQSWNGNNEYTYLLMMPGTNLESFQQKLTSLSQELHDKIGNTRYRAERMSDIHLHSDKMFEPEVNGNARVVYFLSIIAGFIIFIAWVNYINLSTAKAVERAKEVGIRKVMGSQKFQLVMQFQAESLLVNVMAGAFALLFFRAGLPFFAMLTGQPLTLDIFTETNFWALFIGFLVIGSFLSGLYPAFVLSSFQPVTVLKGKFRSSQQGQWLRKALVVFQFGTTVVLIICTIVVYRQMNFLRTYDLGMDVSQTLAIRGADLDVPDSVAYARFESFKAELMRNPEIQNVSGSESLPGLSLHELSTTSNVTKVGQENKEGGYNYYFFGIDENFLATLDMKLVAGRNFEKGMTNQDQVLINEKSLETLGFASAEEAIGARITYRTRWQGDPTTIIGVVRNFYQRSPKETHIPMILKFDRDADYYSVKFKTTDMRKTVTACQNVWNRMFPDSPFLSYFLDEKYEQQYQADSRFGSVIGTFSTLAIFIAALGLFGLSSFTITQRTKEIGIRKVLGASVLQIVRLLSGDFTRVVLVASVVALPVAGLAAKQWLETFENRITLSPWLFLFPIMIVLIIALLTISLQTIRAAVTNPADTLKNDQ